MKKIFYLGLLFANPFSLSTLCTTNKSQPILKDQEMKHNDIVHELTAQNAQNTIDRAHTLLIVDFYAEWCGPCKTLKPIFEDVATELKNEHLFAKINVDHCPEIATKYQIQGIPTIGIFSNGLLIEKITGLVSKELLLEKIDEALKGPKDLSTFSPTQLSEKLMQLVQSSPAAVDVKRYLDAGADANYAGANGMTPLMATIIINASRGLDISPTLEVLLSHGAKPEFTDQNGQTISAVDFAAMMSQNFKRISENYDKIGSVLAAHLPKE